MKRINFIGLVYDEILLLTGSFVRSLTKVLKHRLVHYVSLICALCLSTEVLNAQTVVSGIVTDAENNSDMPGVSVLVKGTTYGVVTDINGKFRIEAKPEDVLVFSFVGFENQEMKVGTQTNISVSMKTDVQELGEVVVTALGVKRETRSLTYASQTISDESITQTHPVNFTSGLQGKLAGVQVMQGSTGAGSSTKIVLRGNKNVTSSNQPLLVIDGIPMANYQTSTGGGIYGGSTDGHDSGDGFSSINPDDIESITVLRGANAAALYGSQGANGVILITTKSGKEGRTSVVVTSTTSAQQAFHKMDFQHSYAQTSSGSTGNWGDKGDYKNTVNDFFQTGITTMNGVTLSGGNDKMTTYFSYSNTYARGIIPTNDFKKNNVTLKQSGKFFNDKVRVSSNIILTDQQIHNKFMNGYYFNPVFSLYNTPVNTDLHYYDKNYQVYDADRNLNVQNWMISGNSEAIQNPYWILRKNPNDENTKRFIGNGAIEYQITDKLTLSGRGSYDFTRQIYEQKAYATTSAVISSANGAFTSSNMESWQAYADMLLKYDADLNSNWDLHAILGTAYQKRVIGDGTVVSSGTYGLTIANIFTLQNVASLKAFSNGSQMSSRMIKESVFANVSLGYKSMIYLDLSGRNDWASTLAFTNDLSYFYPSAGLTIIVSEMVKMPRFIDYTKVRSSFARVANEIPAFLSNPSNSVSVDGVSFNTTAPYTNLKPEMQDSYELGLEFKLFKMVSFEGSIYQIDSKDQFLKLNAPSGSGYTYYYVNAGHIRNKGIELTLGLAPFETKTFSWSTNVNFTHNENQVIKLSDDLEGAYTLDGGSGGYAMKVEQGKSLGDIYVNAFERDDNGKIVLTDDHVPKQASAQKNIGSSIPKFTLGWNNNFAYKNFNINFLINAIVGGKFVSMTQSYLDANGLTQTTAKARDNGGVQVNGVLEDGTAYSGKVDAETYYAGTAGRGGIVEPYVYNATNIRLSQFTIGYNFSLKDQSVFKGISLSLVGSNLFFFYNKVPGVDPNVTMSTGNGLQSVDNFGMPTTRSVGFNFKANF